MRSLLTIIALMIATASTQAQQGQVVQLPSISTFSYSGTVVVPDRGTAFLGGNRSAASGSTRNGGLGSQFGSSQSVSQATVKATIIDLDEMDRQILGGTPEEFIRSRRSVKEKQSLQKQAQIKRNLDPDRDGKAIVRYARKMYRDGKSTASFNAYRTAIGMLSPHLSDLAAAEFRRVFGPASDQAVRMSSLRR